jgi:hypothetical protein
MTIKEKINVIKPGIYCCKTIGIWVVWKELSLTIYQSQVKDKGKGRDCLQVRVQRTEGTVLERTIKFHAYLILPCAHGTQWHLAKNMQAQ